jgi:large subunit ribosomal protein L13
VDSPQNDGSPDPPVRGGFGRICERAAVYARAADGATRPCWLSWSAALKTYVATPQDRERNWLLVDAEGQTLGRLATQIADTLRGKRKPTYTPHVDVGDFVVVVNAEKISVTGQKRQEKLYHRHSGYPGGLKTRTLNDMLERRPEEVIRLAVRGMLPKNRLARKQLTKLKIYAGPEHPHEAQKPQPMEIKT